METKLLEGDILHAGETPLPVLKEPGRKAKQQSYMWLYRSWRDGPPIVLYEYQETRAAEHPRKFLDLYTGYLHVDGCPSYDALPGVTLVGCWSHARRYFFDALAVLPPMARRSADSATHKGFAFCE